MIKIERNDLCPCGSGKKYKKCCMQKNVSNQFPFVPHVKLNDLKINGFSIQNTLVGEKGSVLVRASITSDQKEFYRYMKQMTNLLVGLARKVGVELLINQVSSLLLVTHIDGTADLYFQHVPMTLEIIAKHDLAGGQVVYQSSLADIRRISFPGIDLKSTDGIFICFKVGWKFGLFFDLANDRILNTDAMEISLAKIYRYLSFEEAYTALGDQSVFAKIVEAGWFPFLEIIGGEFEKLIDAYRANFNIQAEEELLLKKFDDDRIDALTERWWNRECLTSRKAILEPSINAFKRCEPVLCLKTILTEIEGVIQDARIADVGKGAKIQDLLKYAIDQGLKKTVDQGSLLFPKEFLKYLSHYTFANFNPQKPQSDIMSRHSVGHGGAAADAYTQLRALQAILTLDQISFYL